MAVPRITIRRLKRRQDFLRVAKARRKWVTPGLVLQAAGALSAACANSADRADDSGVVKGQTATKTGDRAIVGVGFTASRKVGSAVARNRAKRRLRAAAQQVVQRDAAPGYDLVLIARRSTLTRPFPALVRDLEQGLHRLGVVRGEDCSAGSGANR